MLHIVLVEPEIPQNTGTIGRLCVCTDARLHLIEPLGFSLDESRIRRAGLDYWKHLDVHVYSDWEDFVERNRPERLFFLSTKGHATLYEVAFQDGDYLVFGKESAGLSEGLHRRYEGSMYRIPMPGTHRRSHNLANAVSIALYEALRQINGW